VLVETMPMEKAQSIKIWLKELALRVLGPGGALTLRQHCLQWRVLNDRVPREREHELLRSMIVSGDTVFDAGANIGVYTKTLAEQVGATGRVYAFEPLKENLNILKLVVSKGKFSQVKLLGQALSAKTENREMIIPPGRAFVGFYGAHFANQIDSGIRRTVQAITLDEFALLHSLERLDFIKCDVEGAEKEVLKGGETAIRKFRPGWLMEVTRRTSGEVFQVMRSWGYRAFVYPGTLREIESCRDGEASNYFFIHPDSLIWRRLNADGHLPGLR
jgi:FkbM family methyltransferase